MSLVMLCINVLKLIAVSCFSLYDDKNLLWLNSHCYEWLENVEWKGKNTNEILFIKDNFAVFE